MWSQFAATSDENKEKEANVTYNIIRYSYFVLCSITPPYYSYVLIILISFLLGTKHISS